ncbi:uncharacterized protein CPUR_03019 [Claviceps purpurea 20.1]|uniref:F-box domain-containing protein n=1 Tax=Claviceps purpurea (strain 20.1) TaxID=1111077 RepID=M1W0E8_CLAP2|nr:uncharacterized protein CPUR_03019 [Claviceps purpurea 20.1]
MSSSSAKPTMAYLIKKGRRYVAAEEYGSALKSYLQAAESCPCSSGPYPRFQCRCKNFKKAVAQGGSIIGEAMKTCHCGVGKHFITKCANVHHIKALDGRAATFQALGRFSCATRDAEWILELAPQLPDGYLRLGKIAQLQRNGDFAWEIYTMGIEAVKETTTDSSPKLQQLYNARKSVNRHVLRQDPLCLPADLCLRVSKKWTRTLTSPLNARLWRDMQFSDWCVTPGPEALKRMLSWAGDGGARKIVIPYYIDLTESMLTTLLDESPCLEYLKIEKLSKEILFPANGKTLNKLSYLSLETGYFGCFDGRLVDNPGGFPCSFLQNAAGSLEHLDFMGIPEEWYESEEPFIPFLPKLKTLRINERQRSGAHGFMFPMYPLSIAFPRLEQLFIGPDISYFDPAPVSVWRDNREDIWPHLKVLIFEINHFEDPGFYTKMTRSALRCLTCVNRGNSLEHIGLECPQGWPDTDIFSGSDDLLPDFDIVQDSEFKNLRSFRTTSLSISPEGARNLLYNAIHTNQLRSFDIVFPMYFERGPGPNYSCLRVTSGVGERHAEHLRGYDWARGAPSIQSLGCYGLSFDSSPNNDHHHVVVHFVASFPNLRTLSVGCNLLNKMADYASFLVEILRHTHLETMYVEERIDYHAGARAQVRQVACEQGVQLMKLPESSYFDMDLEALDRLGMADIAGGVGY